MTAPSPTAGRVLMCWTCSRVEPCSQAEVLEYALAGWPRCCDEVMSLVTETPAAVGASPSCVTLQRPLR